MKTFILIALLSGISFLNFAQQDSTFFENEQVEKKGFFNSPNVYYGGYLNVQLGTYSVVGATPLIAYKITPRFSTGAQFTYNYIGDKRTGTRINSTNYGASVFSRFRIIPELYLHAEYQQMNFDYGYDYGGEIREWVPFFFVGGGFSQPVSENVWLNAQVLFDVLQSDKSPYANWEPFYSVGFGVGF